MVRTGDYAAAISTVSQRLPWIFPAAGLSAKRGSPTNFGTTMIHVFQSAVGVAMLATVALVPSGGALSGEIDVVRTPEAELNHLLASLPAGVSKDFVSLFACAGTIMHQSFQGQQESPLAFWFGVRSNNEVTGMVTNVGAPLNLPQDLIHGRFAAQHNQAGQFTGGRMVLDWPYANRGRPVELGLMRETFVRVGRRVNGIAKVRRRTTSHTYVAGSLWFDSDSHPSLNNFYRISFISATCMPEGALPPLATSG